MERDIEKGGCTMDCCIKKGKYKAVFSDIDGTLLNTSHKIPEKTRDKIRKMNQKGYPFVLVSARMPKGMTAIRDELGKDNPMICYSGALVVDGYGNSIYSVALERQEAVDLQRFIHQTAPEVSINIYSKDHWMAEDLTEFWVNQEMEITGVRAEEVSFDNDVIYQEVHKILCMGPAEQISSLEKSLLRSFPEIRIYKSKDTYLEIMSMDASKSAAVHMLEKRFGIRRDEIIAFGDGHNDIDMLQYAGTGVAMGNASKEVKQAADIVTDDNNSEGLRQILDLAFDV